MRYLIFYKHEILSAFYFGQFNAECYLGLSMQWLTKNQKSKNRKFALYQILLKNVKQNITLL